MTTNGIVPLVPGPAAREGQGVSSPAAEARHRKLVKAAQDFEAVFVGSMLKQMRKSITGGNALFGNSSEAKMYQEMMDDATAQQMSHTGAFGLANLLLHSLEPKLTATKAALHPSPAKTFSGPPAEDGSNG
jgi:Rod binding domain-containing protein